MMTGLVAGVQFIRTMWVAAASVVKGHAEDDAGRNSENNGNKNLHES